MPSVLPNLVSVAEAAYVPQQEEAIVWTPEKAEALAHEKARKYKIDEYLFVETMRRESSGFKSPDIQSGYQFHGKPEPSYGYAQFFIPSTLKTADGKEITKEIATDPEQALDAAAFNFSEGHASQWTEYRRLLSK